MEEKTVQKIDNLIETLSENLEKILKKGEKSTDEIKALAELITARASVEKNLSKN